MLISEGRVLKWVCKHWPRTLSPPFLIRFFSFAGQKVNQFLCLNSSKTTSCFKQPPFYSPFSFILLSHHSPHAENACSGPRTEQTTFTFIKLIKMNKQKNLFALNFLLFHYPKQPVFSGAYYLPSILTKMALCYASTHWAHLVPADLWATQVFQWPPWWALSLPL